MERQSGRLTRQAWSIARGLGAMFGNVLVEHIQNLLLQRRFPDVAKDAHYQLAGTDFRATPTYLENDLDVVAATSVESDPDDLDFR